MTQRVLRETLNGEIIKITFPSASGRWLVKNFSNNDIFVSFNENVDEATSIKIASNMYQICIINERNGAGQEKRDSIYIKGTGEVEVQQLWW